MGLCFRGANDQLRQPPRTPTVALRGRTKAVSVLTSIPELSVRISELTSNLKMGLSPRVSI